MSAGAPGRCSHFASRAWTSGSTPGWQFQDDGNVTPAVARVLAAAREAGISPGQLGQNLKRRAGLSGGRTLLDSLRDGDEQQVLAALRS